MLPPQAAVLLCCVGPWSAGASPLLVVLRRQAQLNTGRGRVAAQTWGQSTWHNVEAQPAQCSAAWHLGSLVVFCKLQSHIGVLPHHAGQGSRSERHISLPCSSGLVWHNPAPLRLSLAALSWLPRRWLYSDHTAQRQGCSLPVEAGAKQSNICRIARAGCRLIVNIWTSQQDIPQLLNPTDTVSLSSAPQAIARTTNKADVLY